MKKFFPIKLLSLLVAPVLLLSFTSQPDRANFSGEWKLNEGKSELGDFGRFVPHTIKAEQKEDAITISKTAASFNGGDDITTVETISFDGKVSETTVFGGSKKKSTAKWSDDGQSLVISYAIAFERNGQTIDITGTETWSLTKEGSLSLANASSSPQGERKTKAVYDK